MRQFCENLARRIDKGESISLIFDSTGLRFGKASHWYQTKYGKPCHQKPWRKMHLSMDPEMNVHGVDITQSEVADSDVMEDLISAHHHTILTQSKWGLLQKTSSFLKLIFCNSAG